MAADARTADTGSRGAGAPSKKGGPKKRLSITRSLDAEEAESALPSPRPTFSRSSSSPCCVGNQPGKIWHLDVRCMHVKRMPCQPDIQVTVTLTVL